MILSPVPNCLARYAALLLACAALSVHGQQSNDQIVVRPPNPGSSRAFQIDVPAGACLMSQGTPTVTTSSVDVISGVITIRVTQPGFACFSAGDPHVFKPLTFTVGPLRAGEYPIDYLLTSPGSGEVRRSARVVVGADPGISLVPAQPRPQEDVRVRVVAGFIGQAVNRPINWNYEHASISVSMAANRIVVDLRLIESDFSAGLPSQQLDVPIGRFPPGSYQVDLTIREPNGTLLTTVPVGAFSIGPMAGVRALNHGGLWWNPYESGWGLDIVHHGDILFASWFVYAEGRPVWYYLSEARWSQERQDYEGVIYRGSGPDFRDCYQGDCPRPYDPALVTRTAVGNGVLAFNPTGGGVLIFTIDGRTVYKSIERYTF